MEQRHHEQLEALEEKRQQIEDLEEKHRQAEVNRLVEQVWTDDSMIASWYKVGPE